MTDNDFDALAIKVLAGEATADEAAQIRHAVDTDERHRHAFQELHATWTALREMAPVMRALEADPELPPSERLSTLLAEVRRRGANSRPERPANGWGVAMGWLLGRRVVLGAIALAVVLMGVLLLFWSPSGVPKDGGESVIAGYALNLAGRPEIARGSRRMPAGDVQALTGADELTLAPGASVRIITPWGITNLAGPRRVRVADLAAGGVVTALASGHLARPLQLALFEPTPRVLGAGLLVTTRRTAGVSVYAPRNATASLTPAIVWKQESGKSYEVAIADELRPSIPVLRLANAVSPVDFQQAWPRRQLTPDGLYRLTVRESGNAFAAAEHTFTTLPAVESGLLDDPAARLARAYERLSSDPPCVGDALVDLLALPPSWANTELALRLKLVAFGQLGLAVEYQETAAALAAR